MSLHNANVRYPGIPTTTDGTGAAVWVETHGSSGAAIYPITPSTNMGVGYQQAVSDGMVNVFGEKLVFIEPESEHSAASACEGYALAGGRVTNFTAGQGLILMKEVLYTMAGKRLPAVFHIGARALTTHALNVHAGHDDVMGVTDCGWGIVFARNAQEVADLALIARRAAEASYVPFLVCQDGFLTTHTVERTLMPEPELIKEYLGSPEKLVNLMDPDHPVTSGTVQNQDAYMRGRIAQRSFYRPLKGNLRKAMATYGELTGRAYNLIDCFMMEDAEYAIVGMGSFMETAMATARHLRATRGEKVGVVNVVSYRPFPDVELVEALKNCKAITVLERMDDPGAPCNPLARDLKAAFADAMFGYPGFPTIARVPIIQDGAGGLGSHDVRSCDFIAMVDNVKKGLDGKMLFCVGINHEDSLPFNECEPDVRPENSFSMRGHSVGGYGSVTTNKIIASICGDLFDLDVQAYPKYGAEKKGLPTTYYLTIAPKHIEIHQELNIVDFVPVNDVNAFLNGNPLAGLKDGGTIFMQTGSADPRDIWMEIPKASRAIIRSRGIKVLGLDAIGIAKEISSAADLIQRMQGIVLLGVFLRSTPFAALKGMSEEDLLKGVEKVIRKYFGKRDERIVQDNMKCVLRGYRDAIEVPRSIIEEVE